MQFERFYSLNHDLVAGLHTYITWDFSQLSRILGNVCVGSTVSVQQYSHPQQLMVLKYHIYMNDVGVGCSLKGSTASTMT